MKKLQNLVLNKAVKMTGNQMKHIFGGYGGYDGSGEGNWCKIVCYCQEDNWSGYPRVSEEYVGPCSESPWDRVSISVCPSGHQDCWLVDRYWV